MTQPAATGADEFRDQAIAQLTSEDVEALVRGCAVLGVGGGGNAETGGWAVRHALAGGISVPLVTVDDLSPDDLVMPMNAIGAPTISQEMIPSGEEPARLVEEVRRQFGRAPTVLMCTEIGGANGVRALGWSAMLGLPLLDADGMGRAFPQTNMTSMDLAGVAAGPVIMADLRGNVVTISAVDGAWSERFARACSVVSGGSAIKASYLMTGDQVRGAVVQGSVTAAIRIGRLLELTPDVDALCGQLGGTRVIDGKVVELERREVGGFVRGSVVVAGIGGDKDRLVRMEIQNENLILLENGSCIASTPDLIVAMDTESAWALGTDSLQFGQRLTIVAWPCDPLWRTEAGLARTGPRAFGYDIDYIPVESRDSTYDNAGA